MQQTEKLYFTDSELLDFSATVVDVKSSDEGDMVALDRTAFYPTGGGQPHDTGRLGGASVSDVIETDDGIILHTIRETGQIKIGQKIEGSIDYSRRLDHMQQHTGQHILSQAFVKACDAETRSFHLGSETSTIDIELESPADHHMRAAERLANTVIFEDRPIRIHLVGEDEASELPLRKESAVRGTIRVIEVEDFDWSPCGGTHARRAGQIGLIAIKSFERARRMTRVEFVCGGRALADYRRANETAVAVAQLLSAERDSVPELVAKTIQENRYLKKRLRDLLEMAMRTEATEMLDEAPLTGGFKLVRALFDGRDPEELRLLASKIVAKEPAIALLGSSDAGACRLVFARSENLSENMGALLTEACQLLGGRGGGRPNLAQGGGPDASRLDEAIRIAVEKIQSGVEG